MNFVYPAFLFGLIALAIPVIIHLFNFRRFKTIYFTNVRFLKNIQEETATKNKLKHLLILISRMLALAFLVFAFAQPFIPSANSENRSAKRAVGIYIDNSFSMESVIDDEQLINVAKRKAEEIVNGFTVDDKFQLLTNDLESRHQHILSKDEMLQMIAGIQISPEVRSMDEIFKRQRDILNREDADVQKIVYELSDFQKNGGIIENDSSIQINLVQLKSSNQRNLTIDSAWFITPVQMVNQQSQLCIRIKNYGEDEIKNAPVTLKLNGQIKSLTDVSVASNSEETDTLSFTISETGWYNGDISIKDYPVTFDDMLYFTFKPVSKIPVLSINGSKENQFIQPLYGNNPLFFIKNNAAAQIEFSELDKYDLIILNEIKTISGGLSQALTEQLENGANILILPAFDMDVNSINQFLQNSKAATYNNIVKQRRNVTEINTRIPLFADVFDKVPGNLSMPYADQSFEINSFSQTVEEPIMLFADKKPMMARYPAGEGVIYLSAVPLDRNITDLPVQVNLFVPMMYKIALSTQKKSALYTNIGETKWIDLKDIQLAGDQTLKVKSADNEFIPEIRKAGNITEINLSTYTNLAGIYSISGGSGASEATAQTLALNYNRSESELSFFSNDELKEKYNAANFNIIDDIDRDFSNVVTQLNEGTPLWKFCIIFVLIFLAAEIALIRLLP
ncbi:MAG: BatA domain-containing protein [Chitinophagales bacterium]